MTAAVTPVWLQVNQIVGAKSRNELRNNLENVVCFKTSDIHSRLSSSTHFVFQTQQLIFCTNKRTSASNSAPVNKRPSCRGLLLSCFFTARLCDRPPAASRPPPTAHNSRATRPRQTITARLSRAKTRRLNRAFHRVSLY